MANYIISPGPINDLDISFWNTYNTFFTDPLQNFPFIGYYQPIVDYNVIIFNVFSSEDDTFTIEFNNDNTQLVDPDTNFPYDNPNNPAKLSITYNIKSNEPRTIVLDKQFFYFRIKINSNNNNNATRIYQSIPYISQNNFKIIGDKGLPAIVDFSGNLHTKDEESINLLNNIYTVLKNQSSGSKGSFTFWNDYQITSIDGSNNISTICDLSDNPVKQLTIYGTFKDETRNAIIVQFSNDGIIFYDTQYNYTTSRGGNFGFNITATPKYIRLRTPAITTGITCHINYS
jgi:hypothetical protein